MQQCTSYNLPCRMAEWPFSACPLPDPWVCGKFFVLPFLLIFLDRTWWISRKPFSFQVNHVPHRWWFNPPRILFSLGQLHTFVGRPNLHVGWWYTTENDGFDAHNFWVRPGISTPYTAGNVVNQIIIIIINNNNNDNNINNKLSPISRSPILWMGFLQKW